MKNDKHFDELFRKGLADVPVPPAPSQDWALLARTARMGAKAGSTGMGGSAVSLRWMKLLGGASAFVVAWYLALGTNERPQHSATPVPQANARLLGSPAALLDMISDATDDAQDRTAVHSPMTEAPDDNVQAMGNGAIPQQGKAATAMADQHPVAAVMSPRTWFAGSRSDATAEQDMRDNLAQDEPGDKALPSAAQVDLVVASTPIGVSDATTGVQRMEAREGAQAMDLLPSQASALSYLPGGRPFATDDYVARTGRWSIAPLISVGHSTWSDPQHGDRSAFTELGPPSGPSTTFGVRARYEVDEGFAVLGGVQYARKGELHGIVHSSPTLSTEYRLSGDYLEVPLAVEFSRPCGGRVDAYARLGGSLQFNMHGGTDRVTMNDVIMKEMSTLVLASGSMGTALDLGVGIRFHITPGIAAFIEPTYQYALSPVVKHPSFDKLPFNPRIHTVGLAGGLSFQLP